MGEFQKRIKAFRENTNRLRVFTDEEATMIQNSMIDLVSIAKKEFQEKFYTGKEISFNHKTKEELFNYIIRKNQERDNWFEKWFGKATAEQQKT